MATLGLILASGEGKRIEEFYTQEEPIKPMIKVKGKRLIQHQIDTISTSVDEIAVLSGNSEKYQGLEDLVKKHGAKIIYNHFRNKDNKNVFYWIKMLFAQSGNFSENRDYFNCFDSVMVLPCDKIFEEVNFQEYILQHNSNRINNSNKPKATTLSKLGRTRNGSYKIVDLRKSGKITRMDKCSKQYSGEFVTTQSGVWTFSKEFFQYPVSSILKAYFSIHNVDLYQHITLGNWEDFGDPKNYKSQRNNVFSIK
jgi:choline kinase